MKKTKKIISILISASTFPAFAILPKVESLTGAHVAKYPSSGAVCVMPFHSSLAQMKKDDLKNEGELCAMSFADDGKLSPASADAANPSVISLNTALAKPDLKYPLVAKPKLNSTNPGVLGAFGGKTEAKFKQSITCSYAPAALASYHVSRILGGAGRTPVAVARTMKKETHLGIAKSAIQSLAGDPTQVIYKTWTQFLNKHVAGGDPKIFAEDNNHQKWIYGAWSDNVKKEYKYTVVSGVGAYDTRYQRFMQQLLFKRVADPKGVLEIAGLQENNIDLLKLAPVVIQMKDVSDMVLLDTLLNQDDRIGNIHTKVKWYNLEAGVLKEVSPTDDEAKSIDAKLAAISSKKHPGNSTEAELAQISAAIKPGQQTILVREMVLKDNDCGGDVDIRTNQMRANNVLEAVTHMSPDTYVRFMKFAEAAKSGIPDATTFFAKTALYRSNDIGTYGQTGKSLMANITKAQSILQNNCRSGKLKLDLDTDFLKKQNASPNTLMNLDTAGLCG